MAQKTKTDITVYTCGTPNGIKTSILLEELGLEYKVAQFHILPEQKEDWFLKVNPNGRIPALTDKLHGKHVRVFESGAILQYLVDRYDRDHRLSYPADSPEHWELMWQMSGLGPMQGQANHFIRYAPEKVEYGIHRYATETRRLYHVLDTHLAKSPSGYLVGDKVTIADISAWGWAASALYAGVDHSEYPHVEKWLYKLLERPGFEAGRHVPTRHTGFDYKKMSEEELKAMAESNRAWVLGTMTDGEK
ncbi:hypothetical protein F66182_1495 [Fusarium sp. NRRL 66182]|nr:hypothetical protein F66182_1495 [Fusarium sp. NRRL 66182]